MARSRTLAIGISVVAGLALVSGCANDPETPPTSTSATPVTTTAAQPASPASSDAAPSSAATHTAGAEFVSCEYPRDAQPVKPVDPPTTTDVPATGTLQVTVNMTEGPVTITMDRAAAPCTVHSFESLAKQGYFDGTSCHRLTDQGIYILQCGDPSGTGRGGPGYRYADELDSAKALPPTQQPGGVVYPAGSVAMANAGKNTNGSQFFFVWADSPLAPSYTYFGDVDAESLAVITTIASRGISAENNPNPISEAKIESVSLG